MKANVLNDDQEAIIREWEQTHTPSRSRSRLGNYDAQIRQKINEGYTQQAVTELLSALGCKTSHQNLSRYLKKNADSTAKIQKNETDTSKASFKSGFSELKQGMRGS
jgi:transposase